MMAMADTQHSVALLDLVSCKELNRKTVWPCSDSIFIRASPVLVYFSKKANWN